MPYILIFLLSFQITIGKTMTRHYTSPSKRYYTQDQKAYYTQGLPENPDIFELKNADVKTFKELDLSPFDTNLAQTVAVDKKGFYFYKDFVEMTDAHLTEMLTPCLIRIKDTFYLINAGDKSIVPIKAGKKLRVLHKKYNLSNSNYLIDEDSIYYQNNFLDPLIKLPVKNIEKFERTDVGWAKDDQHVYIRDQILEGADPRTFKKDYFYGRDAKSIFWLGSKLFKVPDADYESFMELESSEDGYDAQDKNGNFIGGKRQ